MILKHLTWRLQDEKYFIGLSLGGAVFYILCAFLSPRLIPLLEPDSYSYLEFSAFRTSFYPFFLEMMQFIGLSLSQITHLQLGLFALALGYCLYHLLSLKLPASLIIMFYLAIIANLNIGAYHFSILTESLTFSLVLLTITHLLKFIYHRKIRDFVIMGIIISIATAIKPAMLPFCIAVLLTKFLFTWRDKKWREKIKLSLLAGLLPIIMIASLEQVIYSAHHDARASVTPQLVFAKSLMLMNFDNFSDARVQPEFLPLVQTIHDDTVVTKAYVQHIDNFCLRTVLSYEIENNFQWLLWQKELSVLARQNNVSLADLRKKLGVQIISGNIIPFLQLVTTRYIGVFCVASNTQLKPRHVIPPGYFENYQPENSRADMLVHYIFLMLGILFMLASAVYLLGFAVILCQNLRRKSARLKRQFSNRQLSIIYLLLFINGYHLFLAMTALSIPRYLMVSYPMIILALLLIAVTWLQKLQNYLHSKKASD